MYCANCGGGLVLTSPLTKDASKAQREATLKRLRRVLNKEARTTADDYWKLVVDRVNGVRDIFGDAHVTRQDLEALGVTVVECPCGESTCPGWAAAYPERSKEDNHVCSGR